MSHTPGPWEVYEYDCAGGEYSIVPAGRTDAAEIAGGVIEHHPGYSDEVCRANARLIAAAPDLLEALRKLREYNAEIMAGRINYRAEDHFAVADDAIAKATSAAGSAS